MLADRLAPGDEVRVFVQKSHGFALPADPSASIHSYVSRLRRALGPDRDRVVTERGTYRLQLADEELDGEDVYARAQNDS